MVRATSRVASYFVRIDSVKAITGYGLEGAVGNTIFSEGIDVVIFRIPIEYFLPDSGATLTLAVTVSYDVTDPYPMRRLSSSEESSHNRNLEATVEEHTITLELAPLNEDGGSGGYRIVSVVGMTLASAATVALI